MATDALRSKTETSWTKVRAAQDYREFLKAYIDERGITLSDLARAAGFGRGFPGDVISGKRRLTVQSAHAFEKAMRLPANGRKLFRYLVAFSERDLFPEHSIEKLEAVISELRKRPWLRPRRELSMLEAPNVERLLQDPKMISIYAAAGSPELGASFDEVQTRTQIPAVQPPAAERITYASGSEDEFFFSSQFCVKEENLAQLKQALRETILRFVDDSIAPDGDRVVKLLAALHK